MKAKYKDAFAEVYVILEYLDEEDYEKIPENLLKVIDKNRNKEYKYEMNDEFDLEKQPMLVETKAILYNIFRDYLSTPEQKEKIIKMQKEDMARLNKKKSEEYEKTMAKKQFFEISKKVDDIEKEQTLLIEVKKESFWKKVLDKVSKLIRKPKLNAETIKAINDAEKGINVIKEYTSLDEMWNDLDKEDQEY